MANQIEGTHQHAKSGKLYTYTAGFDVADDDVIRWRATVRQAEDVRFQPEGTIETGTPAAGAIAEQAVRDAVVTAIDAQDDTPGL